MAKVYLLTTGTYSDFRVLGAFSSLEALEATIDPRTNDARRPQYNIHTYELDTLPNQSFGPTYSVTLHLPTGEFKGNGYIHYGQRMPDGPCGVSWMEPYPFMPKEITEEVCVRSAVSMEQARKVATEKRQEWLRTGRIEQVQDYWPSPAPERAFEIDHG